MNNLRLLIASLGFMLIHRFLRYNIFSQHHLFNEPGVSFTKKSPLLTILRKRSFENTVGKGENSGHPQKWSTDLPGYRIGIPIDKAHRK